MTQSITIRDRCGCQPCASTTTYPHDIYYLGGEGCSMSAEFYSHLVSDIDEQIAQAESNLRRLYDLRRDAEEIKQFLLASEQIQTKNRG